MLRKRRTCPRERGIQDSMVDITRSMNALEKMSESTEFKHDGERLRWNR